MNGLLSFMASRNGRITRIVVGAILVFIALSIAFFGSKSTVGGVIFGILGILPLMAGLLDICLLAPLFGKPYKGPELREALGVPEKA
ncbi:MAG TPA: YgaP-like transmembrane domain [Aggregatilineaceae bacterium]|nr:YgaP-like transmembrane domain [Aggregatilineaceae bacterium]